MSRRARFGTALALTSAAMSLPAAPAFAHGGSDRAVTSNYRIEITSISPTVVGLDVRTIDVDGTLQITWTGTGTATVDGYEGEPYLRIGWQGVERNERLPATFYNQDRYARTPPPASADAKATPEWHRISTGRTVSWHDHRTHWMSSVLPEQVAANPGRSVAIYPDWQIPLSIDGRAVTVHGTLTWIPPPSSAGWLVIGIAICAIATALLFTRVWRLVAVVIAGVATFAFVVDTFGYFRAASPSSTNLIWVLVWPVVAVAATGRLAFETRSRPAAPTLTTAIVALVVLVVGGFDRLDALTRSQIYTSWHPWVPRAAVTVCLASGSALLIRLFGHLVPAALRPPGTSTRRRTTLSSSDHQSGARGDTT